MLRIIRTKRTNKGVVITLFPVADHMETHNKLCKVATKWSHIFIMKTSYNPISMECYVVFERWQ